MIVPFVIACGECFFCQLDLTAACETTNTGRGAIINKSRFHRVQLYLAIAIYMGVYRAGKQNMFACQKPIKDLLKYPAHCQMKSTFLDRYFAYGLAGSDQCPMKRGSSVAIYGAGPVGLLSAACAKMLGAEKYLWSITMNID